MKVFEKSQGNHISYSVDGTVLSFENGQLAVDLAKEQRGSGIVLDISLDERGRLTLGEAQWYAAQVYIPGKEFEIRENGIADAMGFRQITKTGKPLDMDSAAITLWAMEDAYGRL